MSKDKDTTDINRDILGVALEGYFCVEIYDRENKLKRAFKSKNVITTNGMGNLIDMLTDIYHPTYPRIHKDLRISSETPSVLSNHGLNFEAESGEIFGIRNIEWAAKNNSSFGNFRHTGYLGAGTHSKAFDNNLGTYTYTTTWNGNQYWNPDSANNMTGGVCCDLGWTQVSGEVWSPTDTTSWTNLANGNLYYDTARFVVKSNDELTTYSEGADYNVEVGTGTTPGRVILNNAGLIGQNLKMFYDFYDVPNDKIVGFNLTLGASSNQDSNDFMNAICISFDRGETLSHPFMPWVNGEPNRPGWQTYYWDWPWYPSFAYRPDPYNYYFQFLPWAITHPCQLSFFGNSAGAYKHYYDINLLGLRFPKLGPHAIALGTGAGTPNASDTAMFNESVRVHIVNKGGTQAALSMSAILDYDEGNGVTYTEAGLFFPSDSNDAMWKNEHDFDNEHPTNDNQLWRLNAPYPADCDTMSAHTMFAQSWSKTAGERAEITYVLNLNW